MGKMAVAFFADISLGVFHRAVQTSAIIYRTGAGLCAIGGKTRRFSADRLAGTHVVRRRPFGSRNISIFKKNTYPPGEVYFTGFGLFSPLSYFWHRFYRDPDAVFYQGGYCGRQRIHHEPGHP